VKWTSGLTSLTTAACFVALVAVGVGYAVNAQPERQATLVEIATPSGAAPTPSGPSTGASGGPADLVPGFAVTITGKPSPIGTSVIPPVTPPVIPPITTTTPSPSVVPGSPLPEPPPAFEFVVASFNVLGTSHTRNGARGMASGSVRAGRAARLLRSYGADVVGFQELQSNQLAILQRQTNLSFYPGFQSGRKRDTDNSIGWRDDTWVPVERHLLPIPYFNGNRRNMPYVKLRSIATGLEAWFANFHNPADTSRFPGQQRHRNRATQMEIALANRLIATGLPVFITGDMNERDEYFCALTAGAPMVAARGGTNDGACLPGNPRAVDWIFGSQDVTFTGYHEDRSRFLKITSDHPLILARARIMGESTQGPAAQTE
jgi:Endonuclease/Exonuclease/phosphatase family